MRYANMTDPQRLTDPNYPLSTVDVFVSARLAELRDEEEHDAMERATRKVVSIRLEVKDIYLLDQIAKRLRLTRSGLATELLEVSIEQARASLGIPRHGVLSVEADETKTVLKSRDGVVLGEYQDDAIQIGPEEQ